MLVVASKVFRFKRNLSSGNAEMAELADAHGSGPCESNFMRVQVPCPASFRGWADMR